MVTQEHPRAWTIAETKARLPEILRLAEQEGRSASARATLIVIVPERLWRERAQPAPAEPAKMPMGQWLVANFPRVGGLELPSRRSSRAIPFAEEAGESAEEAGA